MFNLLMKIPRKIFVAVSGGPDSMAVTDFLKNNHSVTLLHFNHGTYHGAEAENFVTKYARQTSLPLITGKVVRDREKGESKEEYWRNERYAFFSFVAKKKPIVLAHNLNDAIETWVFTSIHGKPRLIPPRRGNIIRPFLLAPKSALMRWCQVKDVPFVIDSSNLDLSYPRVRIRQAVVPELLKINPGIYKVIAKMYINRYKVRS